MSFSTATTTNNNNNDTNDNNNNGTTIQLDNMSLEQLNQYKQREESRLQLLVSRYNALQQATIRIMAAKVSIQKLYTITTSTTSTSSITNTATTDTETTTSPTSTITTTTKDVFVPLTESVYVPGTIRIRNNHPSNPVVTNDTDDVVDDDVDDDVDDLLLIELGTGYYIEQNYEEAIQFLQRKLQLVTTNTTNVSQAIQVTRQNIESITITMRGKLIEIQARQQGQRIQQQDQLLDTIKE